MAEEVKEKLLEVEEVRQRIDDLKRRVGEMADYIKIDERRERLAGLEAQQADADFWNNQNKAREVIAATNAERAYVGPYDSLLKSVEDAGVMLELAEMEEGAAQQTALKDTLSECAKADEFFSKLRMQSLLGGKFDACNVFVKFASTFTTRDGYYTIPKTFSSSPRYRLMFQNQKGFEIGFNLLLVPASLSRSLLNAVTCSLSTPSVLSGQNNTFNVSSISFRSSHTE